MVISSTFGTKVLLDELIRFGGQKVKVHRDLMKQIYAQIIHVLKICPLKVVDRGEPGEKEVSKILKNTLVLQYLALVQPSFTENTFKKYNNNNKKRGV